KKEYVDVIKKSLEFKSKLYGIMLNLENETLSKVNTLIVFGTIMQKIRDNKGFTQSDIEIIKKDLNIQYEINYMKGINIGIIVRREGKHPSLVLSDKIYDEIENKLPDFPYFKIWGKHIKIEEKVLEILNEKESINSDKIYKVINEKEEFIDSALNSLYDSGYIIRNPNEIKII
ncbi:MAG: hypothetical protein ACOCP8_05415, partial [archaeon]